MLKNNKVLYQKTIFAGKVLRRKEIINLNLLLTDFLPYRLNYKR